MHKWSSPPSQTIDLCPQQILYHQNSTPARLWQRVFATTLIWEKLNKPLMFWEVFGYAVCRDILSWYQSVVTILQIQYIASDLMTMMCKNLTFFRELFRLKNASAKLITKAKLQVVINLFVNFIHYFVMIFIMILILNPTRIIRACSLSLKWPLLELTTWHAIVSFWRRFWWRWQW